jgi:predicted PurR-regulated permease PerM
MPQNDTHPPQRIALAAFVALVVGVCGLVLQPFIAPILWAAIIAYVTWPVYAWLRRRLANRAGLSAAIMTLMVGAALLVPALWLAVALRDESVRMLGAVRESLSAGPLQLPEALRSLPGAADLDVWLQSRTADSNAIEDEIVRWTSTRTRDLAAIAGRVGRDILQLAFCLMILYFLYREAEALVGQIRSVSRMLLGDGVDRYLKTMGAMVRAVVFGVLMTAFAQGLVAGIGYRIIGVEPAVLLGAMTVFAAFFPVVGTLAIFAPVSAALLLTGRTWAAVFLILWGVVLVHPIDNLLRPLLVSSVTRMPFLLAVFGVLGGLLAFGPTGIFIGPTVLAVGLALWKEVAVKATRAPEMTPPARE